MNRSKLFVVSHACFQYVQHTNTTVTFQNNDTVCFCVSAAEASNCTPDIHKKVEDTVVLSSCTQTESVDTAKWKYENEIIAESDYNISGKQFEGRLNLNLKNFSLTITKLTLQDSGNFSFLSRSAEKQMKTHTVTLHVHGKKLTNDF